MDISALADLVREFSGYDSGQWVITAWQYIPGNFSGETAYIWLNNYADGQGQGNNWSVQIKFNSTTGLLTSDFDGANMPYVVDMWKELRIEVDLDSDIQTFYYDGVFLYTKSWADGTTGGGSTVIDAIDLFANNATSVYYDDISIVPLVGVEILKGPDTQTIVTGGTAEFTIAVSNSGDTDLTNVTITDALASDCDNLIGDLAAGDTASYFCSLTGVTSSFTNTAVVSATVIDGPTVTDTNDAYVEVVPPTSVSLTSFNAGDSGATWVLALAAGIIGVGMVLLIFRRRRVA